MVALNCAALAPSLIESELFGYEKGAFTGAEQRRKGRFEAADGGTLFLDEVGSIPLQVQEKILRVVEYGSLERVGSSDALEVDVRIVAATNADLSALVLEGRFKEDLLDRLSFEVLLLPPLRERGGDVPLLAQHFATHMAMEMGWVEIPRFSDEAMAALEAYPWPGNIRELKNTVERAVYRSDTPVISHIDFNPFQGFRARGLPPGGEKIAGTSELPDGSHLLDLHLDDAVRKLQTALLKRALRVSKYNQQKAARILGLTYHQFRGLYRKYKDIIQETPGDPGSG